MQAYRDGDLTLGQLMAFAITALFGIGVLPLSGRKDKLTEALAGSDEGSRAESFPSRSAPPVATLIWLSGPQDWLGYSNTDGWSPSQRNIPLRPETRPPSMPPASSSSIPGWRSVDRASNTQRTMVGRHPAGRALGYLGAPRRVCAIRRRSRKRLRTAHRHEQSPAEGQNPKEIKFSNRHLGVRSACNRRRPRRAIAASRLGKPGPVAQLD
jgi:hypothetical protein